MSYIFTYITYNEETIEDSAYELLLAAKKINSEASVIAIVTGFGDHLSKVCEDVSLLYEEVWKFSDANLEYPNSEIIRKIIGNELPPESTFIMSHSTLGMDLAPGLSIKINKPYLPDVVGIESVKDGVMRVVRQEFGGMVSAHMECKIDNGVVMTIRPGAFIFDKIDKCKGSIIDKSSQIKDLPENRKFIRVIEPESSDVDITKSDVLVSIGRGIEDEDNIEIAQDLADVLGGVVSCSRPIVDAKWMEKSRQVGTSGQTVKPKVYLACGISGSFQHMGGIKGSPFIIAINKNKKAPIFQVANVGIEADILDFIPELTEAIKDL